MKNLLKNINRSSPLWLQQATGVLLLIVSAKIFLINGIPGVEDEVKQFAGEWFDYVTSVTGLGFSIAGMLTGKKTLNEKSTDEQQ